MNGQVEYGVFCILAKEYYSPLKKEWSTDIPITWMNLEGIIISEKKKKKQSERPEYGHICEEFRVNKGREMGSRLMIA